MPKLPPSFQRTNYLRGMIAEIYAMAYLVVKGYRIVAWRYKTPVGEIDIIARRGDVLAFVEVKLRADSESGFYAITPRSQRRIARAAEHFMASGSRFSALFPRFDAIAVSGFCVRHLDNAWLNPT